MPRAVGKANGTLNVAPPVESCVEKLSPIPEMVPLPCGTLIDWLVTPLLSAPVGRAIGVLAWVAAWGVAAAKLGAVADAPCDALADLLPVPAALSESDVAALTFAAALLDCTG